MPQYKFTIGLRDSGRSATESYYREATDLPTAFNAGVRLITKRTAMLFATTEVVGLRVGLAEVRRNAQLYIPGAYNAKIDGVDGIIPARGELPPGLPNKQVDQPNACIQVVLRYSDNRSTKRYLSFVPDEVLTGEEGVNVGANAKFAKAYEAYQGELTSGGWTIRARQIAAPFLALPILKWTQSDMAPNLVGVQVATPSTSLPVVNDRVQIQGARRKGTDRTSYNGRYVVADVVADVSGKFATVYLGQTSLGNPGSVKINGNIQRIGFGYFAIVKWGWFRAGTHKRGGSFGSARGRRLTRASLDP